MSTNVNDFKTISGTFSNAAEWHTMHLDFAVDGGATGVYRLGVAAQDLVCLGYYANVVTTVAAHASLTMDVGLGGGSEFNSNIAQASLAAGYVAPMGTFNYVQVDSGTYLDVTVEVQPFTAGKVAYNFLMKKV